MDELEFVEAIEQQAGLTKEFEEVVDSDVDEEADEG